MICAGPRGRSSRRALTSRWRGLAALCVVSLALTACSGSSQPDPSATPSAPTSTGSAATPSPGPTANLDAITVTGAAGKEPTAKASWPVSTSTTQSKVLTQGSGRTVEKTSILTINYVGVNGRTGKVFDSSFKRGAPATFDLARVVPGFSKGLTGKKVGDRVLIVTSSADGYDAGGGNPQAGIKVGDSLVFVVDILAVSFPHAEGTAVTPPSGLPKVTVTDNVPTVTIGDATRPSSLVVQPLVKGTGPKVKASDIIDVRYRTWVWSSGDMIEDGYDAEPVSSPLEGTIEGWKKGLVGQTVGSRVMLVVPPAMAYPDGTSDPSIAPGQTLVYVIDILFAQSGS